MGGITARLSRVAGARVERREARLLLAAMVLALAIRIAYVLATKGYTLAGDQVEYDAIGRAARAGHWFSTTFPYGIPHESVARPPGYMAFIGAVYTLLGASVTKALLVQSFIGPIVVALVWLLARRLFDARVAAVAAFVAAVYPNMWQWETRLYSESLALPLGALLLVVVLDRPATARRAAAAGAVMGASILVRPTQVFFFAAILAAFWVAAGARRGFALTAVSAAVAIAIVAPWTARNYAVSNSFVAVSIQDAAVSGTFNPDAASDPVYPWAWRPYTRRDRDIFGPQAPRRLSDAALRDELQARAWAFVRRYPSSVPKAFFWNGLSRTWDVRRPARVLDEAPFEGRSRRLAAIGLGAYWLLALAALVALWRLRRRRAVVIPLLAAAAAMSVVFTVAAATRYRLPFEPAIVVLASWSLVGLWDARRARAGSGAAVRPPRSGSPGRRLARAPGPR